MKLALRRNDGEICIVDENYEPCNALVSTMPDDLGTMLAIITRYKIGNYDALYLIPPNTILIMID